LSSLLNVVEAKMAIEQGTAAEAIQAAATAGRIGAEVVGWKAPIGERTHWVKHPLQPGFGTAEELPQVSEAGWRHVDWAAGTLDGCPVQIRWADVRRLLVPLAEARAKTNAAQTKRPPKAVVVGADDNPLASVPPDWVPLPDVEKLLTRRFRVPVQGITVDLISEVRAGGVAHRIAGISFADLHQGYAGSVVDPPGFGIGRRHHVCVLDWDAADIDWPSGTVGGRVSTRGKRERLQVQLYWLEVERWAAGRLRPPPAKSNTSEAEGRGPDVSTRPATAGSGGRTPRHDWDAFWIEVALFMADNGRDVQDRERLQAQMVKWTAEQWESPPDPATIRAKLKALYEAASKRA
jgi:hypothetical protein